MAEETAERMEKKEGRIGWIDIAKVLGLVIVLMNHAGLALGPVNFFGGMFYVAVFFVLAGYTHRYRPEVPFAVFLKKKAKRLLLPYAGYNLFLFLFFFAKDSLPAGRVTGESFAPLFGILYSRSYLYAGSTEGQTALMTVLNGPTWFLTGLFTALAGFELLLRWSGNDRKRLYGGLGVCFALAWALDFLPVLLPWSLDTMFLHVVLLGAGYVLAEKNGIGRLWEKPLAVMGLTAFFAAASAVSGSGNLSLRDYGSCVLFYLAAALSGSVLAMLAARWMERHLGGAGRLLAFVGRHTIGILCLHLFVFMFLQAGCSAAGIPSGHPAVQAVMILAAFAVLTPVWKWKKERSRMR